MDYQNAEYYLSELRNLVERIKFFKDSADCTVSVKETTELMTFYLHEISVLVQRGKSSSS